MKHSSSALKETHKLSEARKDIARIKTQINQDKRSLENE
jgi:ribosomal protein L29